MDAEKLAKLSSVAGVSYVQRLGYLLDKEGAKKTYTIFDRVPKKSPLGLYSSTTKKKMNQTPVIQNGALSLTK